MTQLSAGADPNCRYCRGTGATYEVPYECYPGFWAQCDCVQEEQPPLSELLEFHAAILQRPSSIGPDCPW